MHSMFMPCVPMGCFLMQYVRILVAPFLCIGALRCLKVRSCPNAHTHAPAHAHMLRYPKWKHRKEALLDKAGLQE